VLTLILVCMEPSIGRGSIATSLLT
jgi:hypothetical protein